MGGHVVFLDHTQARLGERESIADVARSLDAGFTACGARVRTRVLDEMAATTDIPVVNALSDKFHPCQALADYFTLEESSVRSKDSSLPMSATAAMSATH
jgi:ornithine carbamoyltransferase